MTIEQIYNSEIRQLPADERLRLAARIIIDLTSEPQVDESDSWSDEDLRDFTASTWRLAERRYPETEDA